MKHPLHPALVHVPVACWLLAPLADFGALLRWPEQLALASAGLAGIGCAFGLLAAGAGMFELVKLGPEHPASRTAMRHMGCALLTWCLFAASLVLRARDGAWGVAGPAVLALDAAGLLGVLITGWLGGTLVYVYGVGVRERA